jgi:acyl carrier protein
MESKLNKIFSDVFLVDINSINESISQDSLSQWDSIGHLNLITSIEEEFSIIFSEQEITDMLNYKLVLIILKEAIIKKQNHEQQ